MHKIDKMLQTQTSAYHLKLKNCRQISAPTPSAQIPSMTTTTTTQSYSTSTLASNSSRTCSDTASEIIDADYVDKNIPKMELLKINYVQKIKETNADELDSSVQLRAKIRSPKTGMVRSHSDGFLKMSELAKLSSLASTSPPSKQSTMPPNKPLPVTPTHHHHPLKYAVYKKHNANEAIAIAKQEKLQYTNDEAFFKSKKRYLVFDTKKRSTQDNIQFYFDSKSYERHVDNKMYGVLNCEHKPTHDNERKYSSPLPASVSMVNEATPVETKSTTWNFVKATRSLLNNSRTTSNSKVARNVQAKKMSRDASLVDLTRIGQLFKDSRRASADDILDTVQSANNKQTITAAKSVKKLADEFEHKCICDSGQRKASLPAQLYATPKMKFRRHLDFHTPKLNDESKLESSVLSLPSIENCSSESGASKMEKNFHFTDGRSKSIITVEHGKPLFGHFTTKSNSNTTCGYKNCTFANCPMSSITAALSNVNGIMKSEEKLNEKSMAANDVEQMKANESEKKKKISQKISMTKIDTISNKSKLYLKTKDFNDDDDDLDFDIDDYLTLNNLKNLKNSTLSKECIKSGNVQSISSLAAATVITKTPATAAETITTSSLTSTTSTTKISSSIGTTIPVKFTPKTQNLNNSIKCKSIEKLDFTSSTKSNTNNTLDPLGNDHNRVKIFIRNSPIKMLSDEKQTESTSSTSSTASSIDRTSDFYDSVPADDEYIAEHTTAHIKKHEKNCHSPDSAMDEGLPNDRTSTDTMDTNVSTTNLKNLFPNRLGCDGAIFWNDCYYYDEHACCGCKSTEFITDQNATVRINNNNNNNQNANDTESCSCHGNEDVDSLSDDAKQVYSINIYKKHKLI